MKRQIAARLIALALVLGAGCTDTGAPVGVQTARDTGGQDGGDADRDTATPTDTATPDAPRPDTTPDAPDDTRDLTPTGQPCRADTECERFVCLRLDPRNPDGVCSEPCLDSDDCSLDEWSCILIRNEGSDASRLCLPDRLCIDADGDDYGVGPGCAGADCSDDDPDTHPGAPELCDGKDNDCDGVIDDAPVDVGDACRTDLPGQCEAGRSFCEAGERVCRANLQASEETCDNVDNDCDGVIDEGEDGAPLAQSCYPADPATLGIGTCTAGLRSCNAGRFSECQGQVLPAFELCDGLDNDCDGEIDENAASGGVLCNTGLPGVCARGVTVCNEGGSSCEPSATPSDELCDGLDNDCDGEIDEGEDGAPLSRTCYGGPDGTRDVGTCSAGTQTCALGDFGTCQGEVRPAPEQCDGLDNDCDGETDEGNPQGNVACTTDLPGICAAGLTACVDGRVACGSIAQPSDETCDGIDNDCDGTTDEAEDGGLLSRACYSGPAGTRDIGACRSGMQVCLGGEFAGCAAQVLPGTEICDGIDNDCDGTVDEGNPGGGFLCNSGLPGICDIGRTICRDGAIACAPTAEPGQNTELCDGRDNDCDGATDEDFPGVGAACFDGQGVCRRTGVSYCDPGNPSGAPLCSATAATPTGAETCDYNDDDCDGAVDEDFRSPGGVYDRTAHCGGCGIDCASFWPGGAAAAGVVPRCAVNGTIATCAFDCAAGRFDLDRIAANGCEFSPDPAVIYVANRATGAVDDGTCGEWNRPCRTIGQGLARAQAAARSRVLVAEGIYRENVTLRNGISLLGGHALTNWTRNVAGYPTVIIGTTSSAATPDRVAVSASGITLPTELGGFTINAEPGAAGAVGQAGGNSIGVRILDSTSALVLRENTIFAAPGGRGGRGADGASGLGGTSAAAGQPNIVSYSCPVNRAGGGGGARTCSTPGTGAQVAVNGGNGASAACPSWNSVPAAGGAGAGPAGGTGGRSGAGMEAYSSTCAVPANPIDPLPGNRGARGSDGGGAAAPPASGTVDGNRQWRGTQGNAGGHGGHGSGGGGGGVAGGATDCNGYCGGIWYIGATGGGGGSGGCAGSAGSGGLAGGGSFAVFLSFSSPPAAAAMPTLTGNRLARAAGGDGGSGGNGGAGGDPGTGAAGGNANTSVGSYGFCMLNGGAGAEGGRGGHGGGGSGGAGGASFDILIHGAGVADPGYAAQNTFEAAPGVDTAGRGGGGGNSSNTVSGLGQAGPIGIFGQIGRL